MAIEIVDLPIANSDFPELCWFTRGYVILDFFTESQTFRRRSSRHIMNHSQAGSAEHVVTEGLGLRPMKPQVKWKMPADGIIAMDFLSSKMD